MQNGQKQSINGLMAFTLFSTFALCANLAGALHEFGHALGCWIGGGRVTGFVLRPFDFSYVSTDMQTAPPWSHMLMSGGGILFGIILAVPLLALSRLLRHGTVGWLVLFTTFTLALGLNGVLLLQSVATGHGDPEAVLMYGHLGYGIPRIVMRIIFGMLAIPVLVMFGKFMILFLRAFGPAPAESHACWVTTVMAGFLLYFALMTGHTMLFGDRELLFRQMIPFYLPFILFFTFLIFGIATWVYRTSGQSRATLLTSFKVTPTNSVLLFALAFTVIACELIFLGPG